MRSDTDNDNDSNTDSESDNTEIDNSEQQDDRQQLSVGRRRGERIHIRLPGICDTEVIVTVLGYRKGVARLHVDTPVGAEVFRNEVLAIMEGR